MNKKMLAKKGQHNRVAVDPLPRRFTIDGDEQPRLNDEWIVQVQNGRVTIQNTRTGHCADMRLARLRQFDDKGLDTSGLQRGRYQLNATLVLSGPNLFYSYEEYLEARRMRPQIFYNPTAFG